MGKVTPPPVVVRINSGEAVTTLDQLTAINRALLKAANHHPRVCSQCGAPLHGNKCEYCNTEY